MNTLVQVRTAKRPVGVVLLGGYIALYVSVLAAMHRIGNFEIGEPLLVFAILGIGFSVAAWLMTLRVSPLVYGVLEPKAELGIVVAYLAPVVAFITWGLAFLQNEFASDPGHAIAVLVAKLLVFVIIPGLIFWAQFGYDVRQLVPLSAGKSHLLVASGMSVLLIAFQAVLGRGLHDLAAAHLRASTLLMGIPITFVWLAVEAGVVEEFFFRVLLQTRLAAALKSELGAIVLMSLLFGLAHAPGIYLRTGITQEGLDHPSLFMAVGYSIVITSVAGFFLGVLWARTRNFVVVVAVHAAADLLPNVLPTMRSLHLLA